MAEPYYRSQAIKDIAAKRATYPSDEAFEKAWFEHKKSRKSGWQRFWDNPVKAIAGLPGWKKVGDWFSNAGLQAAMADNPAVMQASGYVPTHDGKVIYAPSEASDQLAKNLAIVGAGGLAMAAAPHLLAGLSNPVAQTTLGKGAESMLYGALVDEASKQVTGKSFGENISNEVLKVLPESWTKNPYVQGASTVLGEMANPGYYRLFKIARPVVSGATQKGMSSLSPTWNAGKKVGPNYEHYQKRIQEWFNKPGKSVVQKNGMLSNGPSIRKTVGKVLSTNAGLGTFHEGVEALYDLEFMRPYREAAKYRDYVNYADALAAEEENRQIEAEYPLLLEKLNEQTEIANKLDSISKQNDLNNKQLLYAREHDLDSLPMLKERLKLYIEQEPLQSELGPNLRPRIDSLVKRYNDNLMRSYNGRQLKYTSEAIGFTPFIGELLQAQRGDAKPADKFISWFGDSWNFLDMTGKLLRGVKPWKVFAAEGIANSMGPALLKKSGELEHKLNSYSPIQLPEGTISIPTSLGTQTVANSGIERGLDVISKAF